MAERDPRRDPPEHVEFDVFLACYLYGWSLDEVESMPYRRVRQAVQYGVRFRAMDNLNMIKAQIAADPWSSPDDRKRLEREFINSSRGDFEAPKRNTDWKKFRAQVGKS